MGLREGNKVLQEFFSSTSCHGLQQIDNNIRIKMFLWLTTVLAMSTFCVYQVSQNFHNQTPIINSEE